MSATEQPVRGGELAGRRVVVTGATRGLGEAIARTLAAQGASVVVNGRSSDRCEELAAELGAVSVPGSVGDEAVADALVEAAIEHFGGVDVVINNAGNSRDGMLTKASVEDFDEVIGVHLRGTWLVSRAAARAMRRDGGTIINVVSGTALYGNLGQSAYAAAKGGILGLTRALALELKRSGIRVNAVSPVVRTEMVSPLLDIDPELAEHFGEPEDVAALFAYLASDRATHIGGEVLGFDGRRLSTWTHPADVWSTKLGRPWTGADLDEVLTAHHPQTANPDEFGRAVHRTLGVA